MPGVDKSSQRSDDLVCRKTPINQERHGSENHVFRQGDASAETENRHHAGSLAGEYGYWVAANGG